jgi:hypothetical protein
MFMAVRSAELLPLMLIRCRLLLRVQREHWSAAVKRSSYTAVAAIDLPYTFTVTGTDNSGCSNTTMITVQVDACTGLSAALSPGKNLNIHPNPSAGIFTVDGAKDENFIVRDVSGKIVMTGKLSGTNHTLDLKDQKAGVYILELENGQNKRSVKLIRE